MIPGHSPESVRRQNAKPSKYKQNPRTKRSQGNSYAVHTHPSDTQIQMGGGSACCFASLLFLPECLTNRFPHLTSARHHAASSPRNPWPAMMATDTDTNPCVRMRRRRSGLNSARPWTGAATRQRFRNQVLVRLLKTLYLTVIKRAFT